MGEAEHRPPCKRIHVAAPIEGSIEELKENYIMVIVTHSMRRAARVSRNAAFIHLGEPVEDGDTERIFARPRTERTRAYVTGRIG